MQKILFLPFLFSLVIFLGSLLLFFVQPVIGKYILPWFGGTSFVWITSLLFFQTVLLAGYFYTYLISKLSLRKQLIIHTLVTLGIGLVMILFFLTRTAPILPEVFEKLPDSFSPVVQVLALLSISVGLPYFLLSTNSTLLQKWFSVLPQTKSPYPLYALSNAGSLLAIGFYPFVFEPLFPLPTQGLLWSVIFLFFCSLLLVIAGFLFQGEQQERVSLTALQEERISQKQYLVWLLLPATSSLLLLVGTSKITQAIAPIPFLWLLPLGLYLLSFIFCFSDRGWYKRALTAYICFGIAPIMLSLLLSSISLRVSFELSCYTIFLFSAFMLCHGEVYRSRPAPIQLQTFYLLIALGSVIGGSVAAIVGPLFMRGLYWELFFTILLIVLLAGWVMVDEKTARIHRIFRILALRRKDAFIGLVSISLVCFIIFGLLLYTKERYTSIGIWRNFYGTIRVSERETEKGKLRCLLHGKIIHGCQFLSGPLHDHPTTYYSHSSGMGIVLNEIRKQGKKNLRIGGVGLGIGTLATYGREGDTIVFYELNPQVAELARQHFTYLNDSPAEISVRIGDGRLVLENELRENKSGRYDVLVIDAFNDDAIPVHLLTEEAIAIYQKHLASKKGVLLMHISTTYIDLVPVMQRLARERGLGLVIIKDTTKGNAVTTSQWAILSADQALLKNPKITKKQMDLRDTREVSLWTDGYSNLVELIKF